MREIQPPDYKFCPHCGNPLGIKIEEERERKYCSKDKWTYYPQKPMTALGVIKRRDEVLMVQRNRNPFKGMWMFPAGFLDFPELPYEGVVREVREETNLEVVSGKLIDILAVTDDFREPMQANFPYLLRVKSFKNIKTDLEENSDIEWKKIHDLSFEIAFENHREVMRLLREGKIR